MSAKTQKTPLQLVGDFFGSYGLCCILLLLLFLLTLLGTLEQTKLGLYDVQKKYFESLYLVHYLFDTVPIPLPGVYLVLLLLAVNLGLGGFIRIQKSKRTLGVIIVHLGIALLLLAGFVKLKFADDGQLTLYEWGKADPTLSRSDEYQSYHDWEIAIFRGDQRSDVTEYVIPQEEFFDLTPESGRSRTFSHPSIPFDLVVSNTLRNCNALPKGPRWQATLPVVDGYSLFRQELAKENEMNLAGAYVSVKDAKGLRQGILWGRERYPLPVKAADGSLWGISLRHTRFKLPFSIQLDTFTHEFYPRTQIPKVYMSEVTKIDPDGERTPFKIEMNEPLRYGGFTLFQASYGPQGAAPGTPMFSTFAVARNPSDHWPLYSCIVIGIGLLVVFGEKLVKYTKAQQKKRLEREAKEGGAS